MNTKGPDPMRDLDKFVLEESGLRCGAIVDDPDEMIAEIGVPVPDGENGLSYALTNLSGPETEQLRDWLSARIEAVGGGRRPAPSHPTSGTAAAQAAEAVEAMMAELSLPGAPMPDRERLAGILATVLSVVKHSPPVKDPGRVLLHALATMVENPRIVSTGDLGRALDPSLKTERACSLGGNRMRQMLARGWVVRERFARWSVTEEGKAEHERRAGDRSERASS